MQQFLCFLDLQRQIIRNNDIEKYFPSVTINYYFQWSQIPSFLHVFSLFQDIEETIFIFVENDKYRPICTKLYYFPSVTFFTFRPSRFLNVNRTKTMKATAYSWCFSESSTIQLTRYVDVFIICFLNSQSFASF